MLEVADEEGFHVDLRQQLHALLVKLPVHVLTVLVPVVLGEHYQLLAIVSASKDLQLVGVSVSPSSPSFVFSIEGPSDYLVWVELKCVDARNSYLFTKRIFCRLNNPI